MEKKKNQNSKVSVKMCSWDTEPSTFSLTILLCVCHQIQTELTRSHSFDSSEQIKASEKKNNHPHSSQFIITSEAH